MGTLTPKVGLYKPADEEYVEVNDINNNSDKTDAALGAKVVTSGSMPALSDYVGQMGYHVPSGNVYASDSAKNWILLYASSAAVAPPASTGPVSWTPAVTQAAGSRITFATPNRYNWASLNPLFKMDITLTQQYECLIIWNFKTDVAVGASSTSGAVYSTFALSGATSLTPVQSPSPEIDYLNKWCTDVGHTVDAGTPSYWGHKTTTYKLLPGVTTVEIKATYATQFTGAGEYISALGGSLEVIPLKAA